MTNTKPNTERDEQAPTRREKYIDFTAIVALSLGLGALGLGTGLHISLLGVQGAIRESTRVPLEVQAGPELYDVLLSMQTLANGSLYAAGALLIGGGILAERKGLREELNRLADRLSDHNEGDTDG